MINDIRKILKKLGLKDTGKYESHFYVIYLDNSDEYAEAYSLLDKNAINTENPNFGLNTNKNLELITNYFEITVDNITYTIFLIADFKNDLYKVKIGEI